MKTALSLLGLLLTLTTYAQPWADLETGLVLGTRYNTIRIPNAGGTTFDPGKDLRANPQVYYRLRGGWNFGRRGRHTLTALYAPLTVGYEGSFGRAVTYNNVTFGPEENVRVSYTFNSYRLTYRYAVVATERLRLGVGFTGKIRDANVRLRSDQRDTNFDNVGFVPLLNLFVLYAPSDRWRLMLDADALGSRFGRAADVFLGAIYRPTGGRLGIKAGYRVVEGGADNDQIYNFTWINYAALGLTLGL